MSYNTKVFNKEMTAMRKEEEALLSISNSRSKREHHIDSLKYLPTPIDFKSVR